MDADRPVQDLAADIAARTDSYFNRTKKIVARFGDKRVTYAVFLRRPVICAPRLMLEWLRGVAELRDTAIDVDLIYQEGDWIGAGEPIVYLTGSLVHLSDLETILLQKIGATSVAAHNAYQMALSLPSVAFLAMEARHCAGTEMHDMMSYAASVGSSAARREGAKGFVGSANDCTAHWFGALQGAGTMPHSLIGYAGSTVRAAEMFRETFPDEPMTVLVDYFGREVSDGLAVCARFPHVAAAGELSFRLDTHGGRFLGGPRSGGKLRGAGALCPRRDPPLPQRFGTARAGRHRGVRSGDLADAGGAGSGRLRQGPDCCLVRLRGGEMPRDGGCESTDRRSGNG